MLNADLALRTKPNVYFAGLITGVEGYIESCALGLLCALMVHGRLTESEVPVPPPTTAMGGLYHHVSRERAKGEGYGPTNINFGLLPGLDVRAKKRERKQRIAERAYADLGPWLGEIQPISAS